MHRAIERAINVEGDIRPLASPVIRAIDPSSMRTAAAILSKTQDALAID